MRQDRHRLHWTPDAVAFNLDQFRDWVFSAPRGDRCLYHIGQLLVDQEERPGLKALGDYAALMSDYGAVVITQKRIEAGMYQYFAARRDFNILAVPKSLATGAIDVETFISLRSILERPTESSARRVIRDVLSCSEAYSQEIMDKLIKQGFVKAGRPPTVTNKGREAMV